MKGLKGGKEINQIFWGFMHLVNLKGPTSIRLQCLLRSDGITRIFPAFSFGGIYMSV